MSQRAIALDFIAKSMTSVEQLSVLSKILLYRYHIEPSRIIAFMRDGCSTNNATLNLIKIISPTALDITCMSHGCNIFGSAVMKNCVVMGRFISRWSALLSVSTKARRKFRSLLPKGENIAQTSEVRWFADFEVACQVYKHWNDVIQVVNDPISFADESRRLLRIMIQDDLQEIRLQLSVVHDKCASLCTLCHDIEGDGFISPIVYDLWSARMKAFNSNEDAPNLRNELMSIYPDDDDKQKEEYSKIMNELLCTARNKIKDDEV